jgi:hypothetical protein
VKTYLILIIFLASLIPAYVQAQNDREDVIYLKNGTIYRGTMLQQEYGVSYKIEIAGGSVIVVKADDVLKVTKEAKAYPPDIRDSGGRYMYTWDDRRDRYRKHKILPPYGYKDKGGFFQIQFSGQYAGGGVRVMGGYKINQFAFIGAGLGFDGVSTGANIHSLGGDPTPYSAVYFPFFIHYSGDILKKDITPFYELDLGYSFAANGPATNDDPSYYGGIVNTTSGGPMGSTGFGVRIYAGRKFVFTVCADIGIQYARTEVDNYPGGYSGPPAIFYGHTTMLLPGIRIGLGLVK